LYFDYPDVEHFDAKTGTFGNLPPKADAYIWGGGAITTKVGGANTNLDGFKIAWGIGMSYKNGKQKEGTDVTPLTGYDRDATFFSLIGSRDDRVQGTEWVPCASCMSPLFDKEYEIKHDAVVYLNGQKVYKADTVMNNRQSFEETIAFIGSGRVVLTDSYHGAYWATLLGRTAIIVNAYSSKFFQYRHQPLIVKDTRHLMEAPRVFPEALQECRDANIQFHAKVQDCIRNSTTQR